MLGVTPKVTEKLDLVKPLTTYCEEYYGPEEAKNVTQFLSLANSLRAEVASPMSVDGAGFSGHVENLTRYLAVLNLLEQKFNFERQADKSPASSTVKGVKFQWSDSFKARSMGESPSIAYERACVLFNLAAAKSIKARDSDRSSPEGQKAAITEFQAAAGMFAMIKDNVLAQLVSGRTSADLSNEGLSLCASLMLAQAQALVYEKAVKDKLNRGLLSKLASQTGNYYHTAASFAGQLDAEMHCSWKGHCHYQEMAFLAAANLQAALNEKPRVLEKLEGFGPLIARLRYAKSLCDQADALASEYKLIRDVDALRKVIEQELAELEKDNNTVYLEVVPDKSSLSPLAMISLVKATPITVNSIIEPYAAEMKEYGQILDNLAPANVREKAQQYKSLLESQVVGPVDEAFSQMTELINDALAERGLPSAVQKQAADDGDAKDVEVPDSVWLNLEKARLTNSGAGPLGLKAQIDALDQMSQAAEHSITKCEDQLREEAQEDSRCHDRFGDRWNRTPSDQVPHSFFTQLQQYREKLNLANETNAKLRRKVDAIDAGVFDAVSKKTKEELEADLRSTSATPGQSRLAADPKIEAARIRCAEAVDYLQAELANVKEEVESSRQNALQENPTPSLLQRQEDLDAAVQELLAAHSNTSVLESIQSLQTRCLEPMIASFNEWNSAVVAKIGQAENSRQGKLHAWDSAATALITSSGEASEGVAFFSRLLDYLGQIDQQIGDYVFARTEEKNGMLRNLQGSYGAPHGQ
ncbi:hypothetical protein FOZ62_026076, partial [Perkinsus olseni]